jgi:hypothetical protein
MNTEKRISNSEGWGYGGFGGFGYGGLGYGLGYGLVYPYYVCYTAMQA